MTLRLISRTASFTNVISFGLIAKMFAGQEFALFNLRDPKSLFQDTAGTIPVTELDDPVSLVLDRSGNGYSLIRQGTDAQRPLWVEDDNGNRGLSFINATQQPMQILSGGRGLTGEVDGCGFITSFTAAAAGLEAIVGVRNDSSTGAQFSQSATRSLFRRNFGGSYTDVTINAAALPTVLGARVNWQAGSAVTYQNDLAAVTTALATSGAQSTATNGGTFVGGFQTTATTCVVHEVLIVGVLPTDVQMKAAVKAMLARMA